VHRAETVHYDYGEAVLDEGPLKVFEVVSREGEPDMDAVDADGEESEGVSIGTEDSSGGELVCGGC
jgi:hypothetical protein